MTNKTPIKLHPAGDVKPTLAGHVGYMYTDPGMHTNDALQFAATVIFRARDANYLPITTDLSQLLSLDVIDRYPSQRGGQKMDIGKLVAADLANGVYTATFTTDRVSAFDVKVTYDGPTVGDFRPIDFRTKVTVGEGTKLSIPDAVECPEKVFTVKGKKGGDILTMLLTIVTKDGKTLVDAPETVYVAGLDVGSAYLHPVKQQQQRESIAFGYVIPTPPAGLYHICVQALNGSGGGRYILKLVDGDK